MNLLPDVDWTCLSNEDGFTDSFGRCLFRGYIPSPDILAKIVWHSGKLMRGGNCRRHQKVKYRIFLLECERFIILTAHPEPERLSHHVLRSSRLPDLLPLFSIRNLIRHAWSSGVCPTAVP